MCDRELVFAGRLVGGRFVLDQPAAFAEVKRQKEGRRIQLRLEDEPEFSDASRKYYFKAIVTALSRHSGHTVRTTHRELKVKFLVRMDDNGREYIPSLAHISDIDRAEYYDRCHAYLGELGIILPDPP